MLRNDNRFWLRFFGKMEFILRNDNRFGYDFLIKCNLYYVMIRLLVKIF